MISYESFKELCERRRSIRYFDASPLEREQIEMLMDLAQLAPSVQNTQPWKFHVITNQKMKEDIMQSSCYGNFVPGASAFVIIACDLSKAKESKEILWNPRELEYSCIAASEHIVLGATAMGLGSCWVSLHHGIAHEALKLPKHYSVLGGLMIGKLKRGEEKESAPHVRKSMDEAVQWHE